MSLPSVFGAAGAPADAGPEPASLDEPVPAASSEGEPDADELPEYDVLFAGADQARGAEGYLPDEASEAPVDSGPVAAAGGYQVPEDPTNATLAPPSEEEQDELAGSKTSLKTRFYFLFSGIFSRTALCIYTKFF